MQQKHSPDSQKEVEVVHSNELLLWDQGLTTMPPLDELLLKITTLKPGEVLTHEGKPMIVYVLKRPKLNAEHSRQVFDNTKSFDCRLFSVALEDAAKRLGLTMPNILATLQTVPGYYTTGSGAHILATLSNIRSTEQIEGEQFIGDWEKVVNAIKLGQKVEFSFLPENIETCSIQFMKEYFTSRGITIEHMDFSLSSLTTAGTNNTVTVKLRPKQMPTRVAIAKLFND